MKIEVLYFEGCPNYRPTVERLRNVLRQESLPGEVNEIEVKNESDARAFKFIGSPTIRVDGLDIEVDARKAGQVSIACRRYAGGLPSEEMIRKALRKARGATSR